MRLTFPDDGEEDRFVAGGAASGATPTEAARLTFTVPGYAETRRPEASANAPPSTPRPRQIELGAASSRGQPPPIGRCIHWLATPAFFFHIGGSRSARARPARSRSRTTARSHCGLRRVGRRPKAKARGDGNGKEFNCEPRGVQQPGLHTHLQWPRVPGRFRRSKISHQNNNAQSLFYISHIFVVIFYDLFVICCF